LEGKYIFMIKFEISPVGQPSPPQELSAYHATERETVIACYTAYRLERVERVNGVRFVTLALNDYLSALDALALPHPPDP